MSRFEHQYNPSPLHALLTYHELGAPSTLGSALTDCGRGDGADCGSGGATGRLLGFRQLLRHCHEDVRHVGGRLSGRLHEQHTVPMSTEASNNGMSLKPRNWSPVPWSHGTVSSHGLGPMHPDSPQKPCMKFKHSTVRGRIL